MSLRFTPGIGRRFELATVGLVLALSYTALAGLYRAAHRPFDFDELATVAVVGDGSPAAIWRALDAAADANPPPFYILTALGRRLVDDPHVAYRLPPLLGFIGIPVALFVLVGSRYGRGAGLAAALLPFVTPLFTFYALEARPYTLTTCCVAWAWVMWQQVEKRGRAAALGVLLAAATALHYYAVLAVIPLGLAELTRTARISHLRARVWVAMLAPCVPLAAFWPLLSQFRQQYGGGFWAQPKLLNAYTELLGVSDRWAAPLVVLLVLAVIVGVVHFRPGPLRQEANTINLEEWVIVLGFISLPVVMYVAALVSSIVMVPRYALTAILGVSVAAAMVAFNTRGPTGVPWLMAGVLLVFAFQQIDHWRFGRVSMSSVADHGDVTRLRELVRRSQVTGLPVAVSNGLRYLPMAYYGGSSQDLSFLYLVDPQAALKVIGTDSVDRALLTLAPHMPMRLKERSSFLVTQSKFLLFSENEYWDWLPVHLASEGHSLRLVALDTSDGANHMLFLVETQQATRVVE